MFDLLHKAGIKFKLKEDISTAENSKVVILILSLLHGNDMSVGRDNHKLLAVVFTVLIIEGVFNQDLC